MKKEALVVQALQKDIVYILMGQSGCGKGTKLSALKKFYAKFGPKIKYHWFERFTRWLQSLMFEDPEMEGMYISETGDLFRSEIPQMSPWVREKMSSIDEGQRQSSIVATSLWARRFLYKYNGGPIIIDGSPRSVQEAEAMLDFFSSFGKKLVLFYLDSPDSECERRIVARNVLLLQQKKPIRKDCATPEKIKKKLAYFHTDVIPAINFLEESGVPVHILYSDQTITSDQVMEKMYSILESYA